LIGPILTALITANFTIEHIVSSGPACLARIKELKTDIDHASHGELLHSRELKLELNHWEMGMDQANMAGIYHWEKKSRMLAEKTHIKNLAAQLSCLLFLRSFDGCDGV
jgi:hypothetical protein